MDIQSSLKSIDIIVVVLYLIILISLGMFISYKRRHLDDLFLAGRSIKWYNIAFSMFATEVSPYMLIGMCGIAYTTGMVTAHFEWMVFAFLFLLAMLFIPYYLHTKVSTLPQFIKRRFGESSYNFLSWYTLLNIIVIWLGLVLFAGAKVIGQIMHWDYWFAVVFLTAIAASFTVAGGLMAIVVTDFMQSTIMIIGSVVLTVIVFFQVGSPQDLINGVPPSFWKLFKPASDPEFPWYVIVLGVPVTGIGFWCTDQTMVQRVLGAKNLKHGQLGIVAMGFLKILPPLIFMIPGIMCAILHPGLKDQDAAFLTLVTNYLPVGVVGLIVVVLLAGVISTTASGLNSFSTIFTLDIYVKNFRPNASQKEIKWLGRIVILFAAVLAVFCAIAVANFGKDIFNLTQALLSFLSPTITVVFLIGILWKGATPRAAFSTLIFGITVSLTVGLCHFYNWPSQTFWPHYLLIGFYLFVSISLFMIVVSLFTEKSPTEEDLPTLKETYAMSGERTNLIWILWGILTIIMIGLYVLFQILGSG